MESINTYIYYRVEGKTRIEEHRVDDRAVVMEQLSYYLVSKNLHKVPWIKSIKDRPDYETGARIITVRTEEELSAGKKFKEEIVFKVKF